MSGVGKSTVIAELAARGYQAVDTDEDGLSELVSVPLDEPTGLEPGQGLGLAGGPLSGRCWPRRMRGVLFLGGCSPNQGMLLPVLDSVVLLTAPADVIVERLATRTTNPTASARGGRPGAGAAGDDRAASLRRGADHVVDTDAPLDRVVETVFRLVGERP
jgi:shikimate kinase